MDRYVGVWNEFLDGPSTFHYWDVSGEAHTLQLEGGMLAFTYCQVPVVVQLAPGKRQRLDQLLQMTVPGMRGPVPLSELVTVREYNRSVARSTYLLHLEGVRATPWPSPATMASGSSLTDGSCSVIGQ